MGYGDVDVESNSGRARARGWRRRATRRRRRFRKCVLRGRAWCGDEGDGSRKTGTRAGEVFCEGEAPSCRGRRSRRVQLRVGSLVLQLAG